jgi:hypothetical protein
MAAPNIVNVTTIIGKTTQLTPSNTSANVLLANAAASDKVLKINSIIAANIDGSGAYDATVAINSAANGSGTSFALASTVGVPADASLIVIDKSTGFYLEENKSIVVTSSVASKITYTVSYEEIN